MVRQRQGLPQAFFTASLTLLEGALMYIKENMGAIPYTLQIGTYDDHPFLDYLSVRIPSVKQDTGGFARSAVDMIYQALNGKKIIQHKIIPPQLIVR
jgi:LacI family sucrose operon transcriptional repressor